MRAVNCDQFLEEGYVVIRGLIPPDELRTLRAAFEDMFERKRVKSAVERKPDEPPGGAWEASAQRRIVFPEMVDAKTTSVVDFCIDERTLGVSAYLMGATEAAPHILNSLCNPSHDVGPANWHRDFDRRERATLAGVLQDDLDNRTSAHAQWNIPLYDDDILWYLPGSHRRPLTLAEEVHLREHAKEPLAGGVQMDLKAGDAVAYNAASLHWGSSYLSGRIRRTIHLAYHPFDGPTLAFSPAPLWTLDFTRHLSTATQAAFERFAARYARERSTAARALRAAIDRDARGFATSVAELHPGERDRLVAVMLLARLADQISRARQPEVAALTGGARAQALGVPAAALPHFDELASRFSAADAATLGDRFADLNEKTRVIDQAQTTGSQEEQAWRSTRDLLASYTIGDFVANWN